MDETDDLILQKMVVFAARTNTTDGVANKDHFDNEFLPMSWDVIAARLQGMATASGGCLVKATVGADGLTSAIITRAGIARVAAAGSVSQAAVKAAEARIEMTGV